MNLYRPKSILKLVLIGFSLVALPLSIAFVNAILHVDRLVDQSQRAVFQAVQATQSSLKLMEQLKAMERNARQFQVLGDVTIFQVYEKGHQEFQPTVQALSRLPLDSTQRQLLDELVQREQTLFETLSSHPYNSESSAVAISEFSSLADLTQSILSENSRLIDREIQVMQEMASSAKQMLVWQATALVPVVVLFIGIFTILIARPIKQIDLAIRRLGDGEFTREIEVKGPQDLEYLGKRLDWLRLRLIEVEEQKTKFLRHVSHELKTPLTAIREGAELLVDGVAGRLTSEQQKLAHILRKNSIQLQRLIENLLNFQIVLLRHSTLFVRPVLLRALIDKVIEDHRLAIISKGIKLELDLQEFTLSGDEEKLTVIIDNLLSNAVKFSPYGGDICIRLKQEGDQAVLDVMDSGPGIDQEEREKVFEPFYQGRAIPKGYVKGTGIGLSVVKEYVTAHQGQIEVIVEQTKGAHFRITLPIYPKDGKNDP